MLCSVDFARHLALKSEPLTGMAVPFFWEGSGGGGVLILIFFSYQSGEGRVKMSTRTGGENWVIQREN